MTRSEELQLTLGLAEPLPARPDRWNPELGEIVWFVLTKEQAEDVYLLYGERVSRILLQVTRVENSGCIPFGNTLHEPVMEYGGNLTRFCPAPWLIALAAQA